MLIRISRYARKVKHSLPVVIHWAKEGKIRSKMIDGVRFIDDSEPVPEKWRPWHKAREDREKYSY